MKTSLLRVAGSVAGVASCLVLAGGVASADTLRDSGRDSHKRFSRENVCITKVYNDTDINLSNNTSQSAYSGDATVRDNDDVGDVSTGNASNSNTSNFSVTVTNTTAGCGAKQVVTKPDEGNGGGGHGGGNGGGVVTPPVTPIVSVPAGGPGAVGGEVLGAAEVQQVAAVPVGGVGAGEGGVEYLAGLLAVTLFTGALATRRLRRSVRA